MAAKFEIRPVGIGTFSWVLLSQGRILATGEPYARRAQAEKAIDSLRKAAAGATVSDLTVKAAPARAAKTTAGRPAGAGRADAAEPAKATRKATKPAGGATTKAAAKPTRRAPDQAASSRRRTPRST